MSGKDLSPEPRAAVRVVRPGGNAADRGAAPQSPPMPMAPPTSLPPWLDPGPSSTTHSGPSGSGSDGSGTGGLRLAEPEAELTPEQREVRELLHRAVDGLTPMPGALEQLRRAVPRRRQRRRRIVMSVAATVVLCSLGTFALHSAGMSVNSADGPANSGPLGGAASNSPGRGDARVTESPGLLPIGPGQVVPGVGSSFGSGASGHDSASPGAGPSGSGQPSPSLTQPAVGTPGKPGSPGHSAGLPGGSSTPIAECTRAQLGDGADTVGSPDAAGVVYGTFQVTNVSSTECKVSMPGAVSVLAVSGTDKSWVSVTQHTAGDPAGGLPKPTSTASPVLLAPGGSYLVEFAWVPASGTGAPSCTLSSAVASSASPASGSNVGTSGADPAAEAASPSAGSAPPSVTLGHTPGAGGSAAASAVIADACAGTVYRTNPLPAAG
jgi:hypothetical protein